MSTEQLIPTTQISLECLGEATLLIDGSGHITDYNAAAASLLQLNEDLSWNGHLNDLIPEAAALLTTPPPLKLPGNLCGWSTTVAFSNSARRLEIQVLITSTPSVTGAVVSLRNISAEAEAHETLLKAYRELEKFNQMSVGRELRMVELKTEINALLIAAGLPKRHEIPQ